MKQNVIVSLMVLSNVFWLSGCIENDRYKQAAEVAERAAERQAQQNTEMAQLNREVAEGTRRMVTADAEARKEVIAVHQDIQAERHSLNDRFNALEAERKQIAQQRRTESMLVPAAKAIAVALLATVVVVFCLTLLVGLRNSDTSDAELSELLIHDLVREQPLLLNGLSEKHASNHPQTPGNPRSPLLSGGDLTANETIKQGETTT